MKIVVFGHKRHGKDSACEFIQSHFGLSFMSSSYFACQKFIFEEMREEHGYKTVDECFEDRGNYRETWYNSICNYNAANPIRLGEEIFADYSIYCGIRSKVEFEALKAAGYIDLSIWIDASERLPGEDADSMTLSKDDADIVITNNTSESDFHERLSRAFKALRGGVDSLGLLACNGKPGVYHYLGEATGAGASRNQRVGVYRDVRVGNLYFRDIPDFTERMVRLGREE